MGQMMLVAPNKPTRYASIERLVCAESFVLFHRIRAS
jgi:hypothetical protein